MQKVIVCGELFAFIGMIAFRAAALRKKGVKAFVFGMTDKSDFLLVPCVALLVYCALADTFRWAVPFGGFVDKSLFQFETARWIGVLFCTAALFGIAFTLASFGDSFRVGIDEQKPDMLVTTGAVAWSRNPIYVSFFTFFLGLFLVFTTPLFLFAVLLFAAMLHRQVLREEKFLRSHYGEEYAAYCGRVRRYI